MNEKVFVVAGLNHLTGLAGPVGVSRTREGAKLIAEEHKYMLDETVIVEYELKD